ncbi:hypothetical protein QT979_24095, partial [Microcoleus sp. w2-18bC1]|uniref:hypothetical protein n=1 Tax=unclassified Microcoleus TaxID=2642155 RepID=UPI002FD22A8E
AIVWEFIVAKSIFLYLCLNICGMWAQTQPIIPLTATTVGSAIAPTANPSGQEADLLLNANPSPIQLPTSSDLSGTSTL